MMSSPLAGDADAQHDLIGTHDESRLLWRLRTTIAETSFRQLLATGRLRVVMAIVLSVIFWGGLFVLMYEGFAFLEFEAGAFSRQTIEKIFNLFFAALMVMLVFSSGILLYGGMFRSPEVSFLLTTPLRVERLFSYKFQEALLLSSWGFVLLGSPMLIAYGLVVDAPWYYYGMVLPFMLAFTIIPSGIGAILCMFIVYQLPRLRAPLIFVAGLGLLALAAWGIGSIFFGTHNDLITPEWFEETMLRLSATENRMFPSWWLSSGLLEAARGTGRSLEHPPWSQAVLFLTLLIANALLFHQIAVWVARRIYAASYSRLHTEQGRRRPRAFPRLDRFVARGLRFSPPSIRLLLMKDLRIFRRDPIQWTQFLIFFGLIAIYSVNMQNVRYGVPFDGWVNIVSFLNLAVVGLILSTFTTRFIFPMISLEGRRFWILGLLPVRREAILWGKYIFSSVGTALPSLLLVLASDLLLGVTPMIVWVHQLTCLLICSGLAGIAVGLGARMPTLHETNPSKIAAGFGGTLNLVVSAIYVVLIVGVTAVPSHLYVLAQDGRFREAVSQATLGLGVGAGLVTALALGILATVVPLRIGFRAFRQMEF